MKSLKRHLSVGFSWAAALGALALGLGSSACIAEQEEEDDVEMVMGPDGAYAPAGWPVDTGNGIDWISSSDIVNIMKVSGPAFTSISSSTPNPALAPPSNQAIQSPEVLPYDFMINTPLGQSVNYGGHTWNSRGLCAMSYPPTVSLRKTRANLLMLLTNPNLESVPVTLADNVCLIQNTEDGLFVEPGVLPGDPTAPANSIRQTNDPGVRFELAIYNKSFIQLNSDGSATVTGGSFDVWTSFDTMIDRGINPADKIRKRLCGKNLASCVNTVIHLYNSDLAPSNCYVEKSGNQIKSPGVLCRTSDQASYVETTVSFVDLAFWPRLWDTAPITGAE